jgi:hypothetical protein
MTVDDPESRRKKPTKKIPMECHHIRVGYEGEKPIGKAIGKPIRAHR